MPPATTAALITLSVLPGWAGTLAGPSTSGAVHPSTAPATDRWVAQALPTVSAAPPDRKSAPLSRGPRPHSPPGIEPEATEIMKPVPDISPEEAAMLAVLNRLAASNPEWVATAIEEVVGSPQLLFDEPLRRILRHAEGPGLRAAAARALAALAWPPSSDDLVARIETLGGATFAAEREVRTAALRALGSFATPTAGKLLRMRREVLPADEVAIVDEALVQMRQPEAVARLTDWIARGGEPGSPYGVPIHWRRVRAARTLLSQPDGPGIDEAIDILAGVPAPTATRALLLFGARHGGTAVTSQVLSQITAAPLPEDLPFLFDAVGKATTVSSRVKAARALGSHRSREVTAALADRLAVETDAAVLKEIGAALRRQETEPL